MKNPGYRTYIFLVVLIVVMLAAWKLFSLHASKVPAGKAPVSASAAAKPDH